MTTGLVQCNHCHKTVPEVEAHGWLEVRVWVTRPDAEGLEHMRQHPTMAKILERQQVTAADLPAMIGGDFCCMPHLVEFYQAQQTLETMITSEDEEGKWHRE